jgi:hypothetical protein
MKGTILDFLKLAAEKPELAQELVELAAKYDFEFTDEVRDEDLEKVAGGTVGLAGGTPLVQPGGQSSAKDIWRSALAIIREHAQRDTQEEAEITRI